MGVALSTLARSLMTGPGPAALASRAPALVWVAPPESTHESGRWLLTDAGGPMARPRAGEPLVFFVEKTPGRVNAFAMGVTVGRVEANDVVVDDGSVSRFHAWLQYDEPRGRWALCDADSKNGTWLDGRRLAPKERGWLHDGAEVRVGEVTLRFLLPDALAEWLRRAGEGDLRFPQESKR